MQHRTPVGICWLGHGRECQEFCFVGFSTERVCREEDDITRVVRTSFEMKESSLKLPEDELTSGRRRNNGSYTIVSAFIVSGRIISRKVCRQICDKPGDRVADCYFHLKSKKNRPRMKMTATISSTWRSTNYWFIVQAAARMNVSSHSRPCM